MPVLTLPADAASLTDAVVEAVRMGVQQQELVPEEVYSVYQLADLLGVSRSPVREAMLRLAEVGLVEIARNRGFRIVLPTAHDVEEIFEIRLALEPAAAGRAAERGCPDVATHLDAMTRAVADQDEPAFWDADRALHRALLVAAGNRRAAEVVEQLRATTALLGPPTTATGRSLAEILAEHQPIVDAALAGDAALAEQTMREHLVHTRDLLTGS
ncbi:GntR family transcriptional regulator [Nocardioides rubriscoriae]|uniref:GntR family transcriptional regulator n=1 Tax=Nocardioides rubriscoriae TaxID=642762 RepID=UPI0011DF90AD|nr:GntR family transcriptional regulator [Nocardioides rubriscoriae]